MYFVCITNVNTFPHVTQSKRDNKETLFIDTMKRMQLIFIKLAKQSGIVSVYLSIRRDGF